MENKQANYCARSLDQKQAQATFKRLCDDIASGKYTEPIVNKDGEAIPPEEITTDNFKMCYKCLDRTNVFYTCRKMLPKYWFISKDGKIITLSNNTPVWYLGNGEKRTEEERQLRLEEQNDYKFKRDFIGKTRVITPSNYAVVAVVYNSILIADNELKEKIRKYGFECFGVKNRGGLDKDKKKTVKGNIGLVIKGKEIIKPDDMLEIHHIEEGYKIAPELLEIMPRWLHRKCEEFTANVTNAKEFENLLKSTKECNDYLTELYKPMGYMIIDNSKTFDREGNTDTYIHYDGINEVKPEQVERNSEYRYFQIVPYAYYNNLLKLQISAIMDLIALKQSGKEPCYYQYKDGNKALQIDIARIDNELLKYYPFYLDYNDNANWFTMAYQKGNIQNFRKLLYGFKDNQAYVDKIGKSLEGYFKRCGNTFVYPDKKKNIEILFTREESEVTEL